MELSIRGEMLVPELAVVMIDVQNGYVATDGMRDALGWPPIWRLSEVLDECAGLLAVARAAGIPIVYSRQVASPAPNPRGARHLLSRASKLPELTAVQQEWRRQIIDRVAPMPGDLVLEKTRHSFFAYTELDSVLRNLGVQRLLVAGLQTNVCVEATVRAALERNDEVAVAENAVSTDGPDLHRGALNSMRVLYVEVASWQELLAEGAQWNRAFSTPNYGRDPAYWDETAFGGMAR